MTSSEDSELRLIMNRKLRELMAKASKEAKQEKTPRDILLSHLVDRGEEVLAAAEAQYPNETKAIVIKLAELYSSGRMEGDISGGELLYLFRRLGLDVRIETSIKVEEHGKLVDLSDKFKIRKED
jgi:DNA-binding TFAR19-related protein (PDSD5 family)